MAVTTQVLFGTPQQEIATLLRDRLARSRSISIVSGFMTVEGLEAIASPIRAAPKKLQHLVVGAGTYRAFEAIDRLVTAGVPLNRLFVHLGHTRVTGASARHSFYRYHPMLHSKVWLMDHDDGTTSAFVGSHNITGFALLGLNGEAGVLLEGPTDSPEFGTIREHIRQCVAQSANYSPDLKEAYTWWMTQFIDGLRRKVNDQPQDAQTAATIVIMAVQGDGDLPRKDDLIYFELPRALGTIQSLKAEVHLYLFDGKPSTPSEGLLRLHEARTSFWCKTIGLEMEEGGRELLTDWHVESSTNPILHRAPVPFRPSPPPGMQQVRVKSYYKVSGDFEYLFDSDKATWAPTLAHPNRVEKKDIVQASEEEHALLSELDLIPPEHLEWTLVTNLDRAEPKGSSEYKRAMLAASPESGSYILFSRRRKNRELRLE